MPDSDKSLRIKIITQADTAALDKVVKSTDQLRDSTGKFAKTGQDSAAAAKAQLPPLNDLSDATRKYIKTLDHGKESGEKFKLTHRQIQEVTRGLMRSMPELGHVIAELANPMVGLTLAVGATVGSMIEISRQMQDLRNQPAPDWPEQTSQLDALRNAYDDAEESLAAYGRELDRIRNKSDGPQERADKNIAALHKQQTANEEMLATQKRLAETSIDEQEREGVLTHAQAIQAKLKLDQQYAQARIALEEKVRQAEIEQRQEELANARYREHVQTAELPAAVAKDASAQAAVKKNDNSVSDSQAALATAITERQQIHDDIAEAQATLVAYDNFIGDLSPQSLKDVADAKAALADLDTRAEINTANIVHFRADIAKGQAAAPGLKDNANAAHENAEALKESLKAVVTEIAKLVAQIPEMQGSAATDARHGRAVAAADSLERSTKFVGSLTPDQLDAAGAGVEALQHGKKVDATTSAIISSLSSVLQVTHTNMKDVLDIIKQGHGGQAGIKAEIAALKAAVVKLSASPPNLPPNIPPT